MSLYEFICKYVYMQIYMSLYAKSNLEAMVTASAMRGEPKGGQMCAGNYKFCLMYISNVM